MRVHTWIVLLFVIVLSLSSVEGFQHWDCVGDATKFIGPLAMCIGKPNPVACVATTAGAGAQSFLQGCCNSVQHGTTDVVAKLRQVCIAVGLDH
jgi:hypothetical protein